MFMSLKNSFSLQILHPITSTKMMWEPITDKTALLKRLKQIGENVIYRVAGVNYLGNAIMVTHNYCERMVWGCEAFGRGLRS